MDLSKTNKDFYDENKEKGKLHSQEKDGPPKTRLQKIIGLGYPILMALIWIVGIVFAVIKKPEEWKIWLASLLAI